MLNARIAMCASDHRLVDDGKFVNFEAEGQNATKRDSTELSASPFLEEVMQIPTTKILILIIPFKRNK